MERVFTRINQKMKLSQRFLVDFRSSAEETGYKRDGIWIGQGQRARELMMVKDGCMAVRHGTESPDTVSMLINCGETAIPTHGLFLGERSPYTYQFLTDAEVFVMADRALESLLVKYDDTRVLLNFLLAEQLRKQEEHSLMLACFGPEARIEYAHAHYQTPFQLLTREGQASFLGMSKRVYQRYL
ncbi:Crp/Fnr family transcriptional regulator [Parapedobacter tibetensis]|uniref:Crp/Fnr family transcriptional regulator n=1 Tax=Parapedobacter tibetensis TaxID=2972951 RepID=UPI00214DA2EF|nr:hypothetical protein [Parapedobacter tibetensis]